MRAILPALIFLISHQALALPVTSVEEPQLLAHPISSIEVPHPIAALKTLDSESSGQAGITADFDTTHGLQRRSLGWSSAPFNTRLSVLFNIATATGLQLANGWLTWQFKLIYTKGTNTWSGTVYSTAVESALDLSVCVNRFTPAEYGNTGGNLWSEGELDLTATWRSVALAKEIKVDWKVDMRFYQVPSIGPTIKSVILNTVGNIVAYELAYDANWECVNPVVGQSPLLLLETEFEGCEEGEYLE